MLIPPFPGYRVIIRQTGKIIDGIISISKVDNKKDWSS